MKFWKVHFNKSGYNSWGLSPFWILGLLIVTACGGESKLELKSKSSGGDQQDSRSVDDSDKFNIKATEDLIGIVDVDNDGISDLVTRDSNSGEINFYLLGEAGYKKHSVLPFNNSDWILERVADLNGDKIADLLWRKKETNEIYYWILDLDANGGVVLHNAGSVHPGEGLDDWKIVQMADVDNSGTHDIVWRRDDGSVAIWLSEGYIADNGKMALRKILQSSFTTGAPLDWKIVGVRDVDGDGQKDLIWQGLSTIEQLGVWTLKKDELGVMEVNYKISVEAASVTNDTKVVGFGDFDGDSRSDVVFLKGTELFAWTLHATPSSFDIRATLNFSEASKSLSPGDVVIGSGVLTASGKVGLVIRDENSKISFIREINK